MYLIRKPKVRSFTLTDAYLDEPVPLIIRFKLNSKICPDFVQVFLEKQSGDAILETNYIVQPDVGLNVIKDKTTGDLSSINFIVDSQIGYYDLKLEPIVNLNIHTDLFLTLKMRESTDYIVETSTITAIFRRPRRIFIGDSFFIKGIKSSLSV